MHTEKNSACVTPPSARAPAKAARLGAREAPRLLTAKDPVAASSSRFPGTRLVSSTSGTDIVATVAAYRLTTSPVRDSVTWNAALIVGNRPTGSISVVTPAKADSMRTSRPGRAAAKVRSGRAATSPTSPAVSAVARCGFTGVPHSSNFLAARVY